MMLRKFLGTFQLASLTLALFAGMNGATAQNVPADMGFQTSSQPPAPPTELTARYESKTKTVTLKWRDVASVAVSEFHIFRFDNYTPDKTLGEIGTVTRYSRGGPYYAYADKATTPGHTYTYFITSKNRFGLGGPNSKMTTLLIPFK